MKREEAKREWAKVHPLDLDLDSVIDVIYDDFESMCCENCKYNKEQDGFMIFCDKEMCQDGSKMMWHSFTKDFCCNKWESK